MRDAAEHVLPSLRLSIKFTQIGGSDVHFKSTVCSTEPTYRYLYIMQARLTFDARIYAIIAVIVNTSQKEEREE